MEDFYKEAHALAESAAEDMSGAAQTVVLFRVALERGSAEIGMMPTIHLLSKLLTTTFGIMAGDDDVSFDNVLDGFDVEDETPH
jgi:hypothetical protein|tara:strand:+ start:5467 stop:5718 length:252 start_codon:yes stop_codon:yes gene_type:complete